MGTCLHKYAKPHSPGPHQESGSSAHSIQNSTLHLAKRVHLVPIKSAAHVAKILSRDDISQNGHNLQVLDRLVGMWLNGDHSFGILNDPVFNPQSYQNTSEDSLPHVLEK